MEMKLAWFLLAPLGSVLVLPWVSRLHRRLADLVALLTSLFLLSLCFSFLTADHAPWLLSLGGFRLALDPVSLPFLVLVNTVALFSLLFSLGSLDPDLGRVRFFSLFLLLVAGLNSMLLVRDLFSLYLFLEMASVASCVLVAYDLKSDSLEAALKYLLLSAVATGLILIGISLLFLQTGTLDFGLLRSALAASGGPTGSGSLLLLVSALFLVGFGLKAALIPFHAWLPDALPAAPAPVSALLSGAVVPVAGLYALIRIFLGIFPPLPGVLTVFLALGLCSLVAGAILACFQTDGKRLLAYASLSQVGYILVGLGIGNDLSRVGALFHLFNHGLFSSLLLLNSGAVQFRTGTRDLREMGGLGEKMKVTSVTGVCGILSLAGVPPFNGFWSKLFIVLGALQGGHPWAAAVAVLASLLTLGYGLLFTRQAFFGQLSARWKDVQEAPFVMAAALIFLAVSCLASGVFFGSVVDVLIAPAADLLRGGK